MLLALSAVNLFVMHYNMYFMNCLEWPISIGGGINNCLSVFFDVSAIYIVAYVLSWKRQRIAISLCFFSTLLWSFANIMYSRFFYHYISYSALSQTGSLSDPLLLSSMIAELKWADIYFIFAIISYVYAILTYKQEKRIIGKILIVLLLTTLIDVFRIATHRFNFSEYICFPNTPNFTRGSLRSLLFDISKETDGPSVLTKQERIQIQELINQSKNTLTSTAIERNNVIFILVESYMSFVSDIKIEGEDVTPFLNSLRRDSMVYYNGHVHENVTIGESSDGQFVYMTGLLPLRSVLTISVAKKYGMPGLPKQIRKSSRMIIPTTETMWNQDEMSRQYGFASLFASPDICRGQTILNDEQIFKFAAHKDTISNSPFFSVILTLSMHQPYTKQIDQTFPITDSSMPKDLACYLNACHYTDRQIEWYFEHLKRTGLYDNSLIVIAADHPVHNTDFGGVSKDIPLYIINIPGDIREEMWQGECNQIDVYTTLLDLLGVESDWYGLGHSLLSPNYSNSINSKKWDVSEWIIRGDYFSK